MKMPRVEIGAVQSLGRHDTAAVAATGRQAAATGQQQQKMLSLMSEVAGDYIQRQQNVEYDSAVADSQIQINDFQKNHAAKQFYTADEIPDGIPQEMVPRTEKNFANGETIVTPRKSIPAYEVYPHLLKQELEGMTEVTAEKISNPVLRKEYLNMAQIKNSEMMMSAGLQAEQQQQAFVFTKGVADADSAFKSGHYVEGAFHINNLVADDNVKAELLKKGATDVELFEVTEVGRSTNQENIIMYRSRYTDPNYDGDLNPKAVVADLDAQIKILGAEDLADKVTADSIDTNNRMYAAGMGNLTNEQINARYELWQIDPDAEGAIPVEEHLPLLAARARYDKAVLAAEEKARTEADKLRTAEEKYQYQKMWGNLQLGIDRKEVTHAMIDLRYDMGLENRTPTSLDHGDMLIAHRRIDTVNNKSIAKSTSAQLGANLMGGATADPYDAEHQTAMDDFAEMEGSQGDMRRQEEIAMQTGIMTSYLENHINGNALNGSPEEAVKALQTFGRLMDTDAYKVREVGSEAKVIMSDAHFLSRNGTVDPAKALEVARENARLPEETKQIRKDTYREEKYIEGNISVLRTNMAKDEGTHGFDPNYIPFNALTQNQTMQGEYNALVETYYTRTGDIDRARNMAWAGVKETWGSTRIGATQGANGEPVNGGTRPMKNSPERELNVSSERAGNALNAFSEGHGFDVNNVMVVRDPYTPRDGSYAIMIIDPETNMPIVPINEVTNKPVRWKAAEWLKYGDEFGQAVETKNAIAKRERQQAIDDLQAGSGQGQIIAPGALGVEPTAASTP